MKPRWLSRPLIAAAVGAALFACVDGESPLEQDLRLRSSFAIQPDYSAVTSFGQTAPITRIRLTARDAVSGTVVPPTPSVFDVDPNVDSWNLPLELEVGDLENGQVTVLMELISVVGGVETVEFSGQTAPLSVTAGSSQQVAQAEVHPGNPENLAATSVTIGGAPGDLLEGDDADLSASVGGVSAPEVFWTVLDPTIAQVEKTGATSATVQGLLPGAARVVAAAGTRRDTVSVQVLQRPASVVLSPDAAELESLDQEMDFGAEVLDPRGAPIASAEVTWTIDGPAVVEHLGNGRFRAIANGATSVEATVVGFAEVSSTADVTVAQVAATVTVTPGDATLEAIDATVELEALVEDALGNPIEGIAVTWASTADDVVSVSAAGVATAEAEGAADVTASAGGASGAAEITVHQRVEEVEVEPGSHTFESIGDSHTFTAIVLDPNGHEIAGRTVTWSSTDDDVVDVDDDGTTTAVADGSASVRAVVEGEAGMAAVEVDQKAAEIEVSPAEHLFTAVGDELTFTAEARDARGNLITGRTPEWSSSAPGVVQIDDDGEAEARANGTAVLTAEMDGVTASADVTVEQAVASVEVTPASHTLTSLGETVTLEAIVRDANGNEIPDADVDWSSGQPAVATVNGAGVVTAVGDGDADITASSDGHSASAAITVEQVVVAVVVTPGSAELDAIGATQQFEAEARDANGNVIDGLPVNWSVSPGAVADIDDDGLAVATANGTATVTATIGGESGTATLTVVQTIASLRLEPDEHTFTAVGQTLGLRVIALDRRGEEIDDGDLDVDWATSDDDVVDVNNDGLVTAVGRGTARVTASSDGESASADFTVEQAIAGVSLSPTSVTVNELGETVQFTATATDANGNEIEDVEFEWSSRNTDVATIDDDGLATTVGNGTTTVEAEADGFDDDATVTVRQRAATVELDAAQFSFAALGQTRQFVATVRDANGAVIGDATPGWASSNQDVFTVAQNGVVTAVAEGTATLTVTEQGRSATAQITVQQVTATVEVTPTAHTFAHVGDTLQLTAIARDSTGHVIADETVAWSSTDSTVATVNSFGFVTATGTGDADIQATVQGVTGAATVELNQTVEEGIIDRVLVISGGHTDDVSTFVDAVQPELPDVTFEMMFVNSETPTLEYLHTFDVVLVYENGNFGNVTSVGNAVAEYVEEGGNVVLGTFVWQDWSGVPNDGTSGWGFLENIDPFISLGGSEYTADRLDTSTLVEHPLTAGIDSLWVDSYRGGVDAKETTTVLARWADGSPLIGYRTESGGQRVVAISTFPGYYFYSGFSGDFTQMWVNALTWAGAANAVTEASTANTSSLRASDATIRKSVPAPDSAVLPATGGTSGRPRN